MSLLEEYRQAAATHGRASSQGNHKIANRAHDELTSILKKMRKEPGRGLTELSSLLADPNPSVVCWAATHLLPLDESVAKEALLHVEKSAEPLVAFSAKMVLREWDAGRLNIE